MTTKSTMERVDEGKGSLYESPPIFDEKRSSNPWTLVVMVAMNSSSGVVFGPTEPHVFGRGTCIPSRLRHRVKTESLRVT